MGSKTGEWAFATEGKGAPKKMCFLFHDISHHMWREVTFYILIIFYTCYCVQKYFIERKQSLFLFQIPFRCCWSGFIKSAAVLCVFDLMLHCIGEDFLLLGVAKVRLCSYFGHGKTLIHFDIFLTVGAFVH